MDIICVQQPDGTYKASPFHVRFGKLKLLKSSRKAVTITVNGVESADVAMLLGEEGEAFFLREAFEDEAAESIENVSSSHR
jgi:phosphatidate phosphatase LPIN